MRSSSASTLVVIADAANLVQALLDRHGGDGSTFIMFALVLIAPVVILNRIIRHETVGLETILGAICVYVLHRDRVRGDLRRGERQRGQRVLRAADHARTTSTSCTSRS